MKINEWVIVATKSLAAAGISSARLDCLLLLEDATNRDRAWLLAHDDEPLTIAQLDQLAGWLEHRVQHEPLAYIRGHSEFYGRRYEVTPAVLVPRPESEAMIELLLHLEPQPTSIADIGTGSGCLAITAALQPGAVVYAVDIDEACLAVARQNAVVHTAQVSFLQGDLLEPLLELPVGPEVLLANLPYVPDDYPINHAARHEPGEALFAGADGLDAYRRLAQQLSDLATAPNIVITEALIDQHAAMKNIFNEVGYELGSTYGLAQLFESA